MNEIEIIRSQVAAERQRVAEVAALAPGGAPGARLTGSEAGLPTAGGARPTGGTTLGASQVSELRQASVDYLVWVLTRFEARDLALADLIRSRLAADDDTRRAAEDLLAHKGTSREALAKLEAALGGRAPATDPQWREFLEFLTREWRPRRDKLDALLERALQVTEWRAVSAIDADSILEERRRFARVKAALPPAS